MRGFQKYSSRVIFLFVLVTAIVLCSCGGTREAARVEPPKETLQTFLSTYEKTFSPTAYDASVGVIRTEEQQQHALFEAARLITTAVPETIPGFRIQVLFTSDIDQANELRDTLSVHFPDDWTYVVYDAPNYKVRVGNFIERSDAEMFLRKVVSDGYPDAWIVPDNVIKNPPPRLPEQFIVPDSH